jgi:hypothetical protein
MLMLMLLRVANFHRCSKHGINCIRKHRVIVIVIVKRSATMIAMIAIIVVVVVSILKSPKDNGGGR